MNDEQPGEQQVQVQLPPEVQRGVYANQFIVSHMAAEFVVDCIFAGAPTSVVNARIVMTPYNAKQLMRTLAENIQHYEARFGEISDVAEQGAERNNSPLM